jgi:hypothetical protein
MVFAAASSVSGPLLSVLIAISSSMNFTACKVRSSQHEQRLAWQVQHGLGKEVGPSHREDLPDREHSSVLLPSLSVLIAFSSSMNFTACKVGSSQREKA